jgi:hypothetical protein
MTKNPYLTVWFNTKETIQRILTGQVKFNYSIPILLTVFSGFIGTIKDITMVFGDPFYALIPGVIFIVLGYLALSRLFPWLIKKTGLIWNGGSNIHELRVIIALAQIPVILILLEQIVFMFFGELRADWQVNIGIQWLVWIFYMRILIIGVARTQGFNYGIAFLNLVISVLPLFLIRMIFI